MVIAVTIKKSILNLRLSPGVLDEFRIVAELRGASMSGLLHQFIVRCIREEKELAPQAFRTEDLTTGRPTGIHRLPRRSQAAPVRTYSPKKQPKEEEGGEVKKKIKRAG